jgi:hypothetical protein
VTHRDVPGSKSFEEEVVVIENSDKGHLFFKEVVEYCRKWDSFYVEEGEEIFLIILQQNPKEVLEFSSGQLACFVNIFNKGLDLPQSILLAAG